uniref:Uncharacterized protein n=1 Tax=Lepeophtheirus salmonis TaxID=72036 RepID=A0A0K2U085_LEPSM
MYLLHFKHVVLFVLLSFSLGQNWHLFLLLALKVEVEA